MIYAKIERAHFRKLVVGEAVEIPAHDQTVKLILEDMGWAQMLMAVADAARLARIQAVLDEED